jgi:tRNA-specific 2-thiouridylase
MKRQRVIVAMSGGVDSAVAAARLVDAGHEVVGVTLHLWDYEGPSDGHGRCCAPEDQYDARRTADALGFAHYTFDRRELFRRVVVEPFVDAYLAGETPSPCASCNREVKLAILFELADRLGADSVATGHYARVARDVRGTPFLAEGRDRAKDQSYFLYAARREQLERLLFPLGDSLKSEVRAEAVARDLPGARKGESQDLCFVGTGSAASFVEARARGRVRPGLLVDDTGRSVGTHEGVHRFTVGQRKGLGVTLGRASFVTRIDPASGRVHLGDAGALDCAGAEVSHVALHEGVELPRRAAVRVRSSQVAAPGWIQPADDGDRLRVTFDTPVRAVAPGQIAVFYEDGRVLGGGRIARATFPRAGALLRSSS